MLEIIRMETITGLPDTELFIEGIINLRGLVIPVMDLRKRFGMEEKEYSNQTRIIVINMDNVTIGLVVDSVNEVLQIPGNAIEPPPAFAQGVDREYLRGIALLENRMIILLDMNKLMYDSEKEKLETMVTSGQLT